LLSAGKEAFYKYQEAMGISLKCVYPTKTKRKNTTLITDNILKSQAFKLKGRLYTLTVLHILDADVEHFESHLNDVISKAPRMFEHTPIVLDFSDVLSDLIDLNEFCRRLRERNLIPVAIQGGDLRLQSLAIGCGLAVLGASSGQDKTLIQEISSNPTPSETIRSKLLTTPVRSGQQVVSLEGDLVVVSSVGHGAELLSDGHIHVYGALRGRALAGIEGNTEARIFCQLLDAELVSIAGFYQLRDEISPPPGPCQIYLLNEHIHIEPL
jgi:septum site-determining protein MinC